MSAGVTLLTTLHYHQSCWLSLNEIWNLGARSTDILKTILSPLASDLGWQQDRDYCAFNCNLQEIWPEIVDNRNPTVLVINHHCSTFQAAMHWQWCLQSALPVAMLPRSIWYNRAMSWSYQSCWVVQTFGSQCRTLSIHQFRHGIASQLLLHAYFASSE